MYSLGTRSKTELQGVHPILGFAVFMAIKRTKQDFGIVNRGGVRKDEEQADMYAQGRTREGAKITWTLDSYHQYGLAVDLVAFVDGEFTWDTQYYAEIVRAMKDVIHEYDLPIDHGYDLWGKDLPHWQMTGYKDQYDVRKYNEH